MAKICAICGKKPSTGTRIKRRGLAKAKGGVGQKITGVTRRRFLPNIQKVRARVGSEVKSIRVCVACLRRGKVVKP